MPGKNRPSKVNRDHLRLVAFNEKKAAQLKRRPCLCSSPNERPKGAECLACGPCSGERYYTKINGEGAYCEYCIEAACEAEEQDNSQFGVGA